jgi:uncharacterized membrane protein
MHDSSLAPQEISMRHVTLTRLLAVGSLMAPLRPGGTLLALKVLPLCFPLTGLLKNRMYTYRWLSLMIWLYFTEGVVRAWSDAAPSHYFALAEVFLCVALFIACTLHVRLRLKHAKEQALAESSAS